MTSPSCTSLRDDLVAYLDGELLPERVRAVEAHLAACPACEAERVALDRSWTALDMLEPLEPRAGFLEEIERGVLAEGGGARVISFPTRVRLALAIAAGLLVTASLVWILASTPSGGDGDLVDLRPTAPAPRLTPALDPTEGTIEREPIVTPPVDPGSRRPDAPRPRPTPPRVKPEPTPAPGIAQADQELLRDLDPEELEVARNLELLVMFEELELEEIEDLDVLENADLLNELDDGELGEEG